MDLSANANTRWMAIFVEELARCGLEAVCIAPGSRSTPLTLAFAAQPAVRVYRHLDERSAGFFALGLAQATKRPVALVCTSGTAAANFHPAIIEAYYAHVPLLVLTADRPPELRSSGANQTIDQIKMFGDHVRWAVEAPTPQPDDPALVLRHLRTLAARACATADGLLKGPVHLNFPFRKPLEPEGAPTGSATLTSQSGLRVEPPFTRIGRARLFPDDEQIAAAAEAIKAHRRGLIICGPECPGGSFPAEVGALAQRAGYPILADPLANLRHAPEAGSGLVLGGYHLWLPALIEKPGDVEIVLRFGTVPTSSALAAFIERAAPQAHIHVREDGEWADDLHLTHTFLQAKPAAFCRALADALDVPGPLSTWAEALCAAERRTWAQLDNALEREPFFDGGAVARVLAALPDDTDLFVGNSLPVRHVDTFDRPAPRRITLYGNRGASGIDGNVSTALGLAAGGGRRVVALLGDITFYHDMNGLLAIRQHQLDNVTFVVINNDGGGIFHQLPVARHEPPFTDLFLTPHGLTFAPAAEMYGLGYRVATDTDGLTQALSDCLQHSTGPNLIEVRTNSYEDYRQMKGISAAVQTAIKQEQQVTIYKTSTRNLNKGELANE